MENVIGFGAILGIGGVVLVALLIGAFIMRRWIKVAGADEALVISGKKGKSDDGEDTNVQVVVNGKAIVNPVTQQCEVMSLRSRQVVMGAVAQSADNITLKVEAVALVKISSNRDYVRRAAERFASQDDSVDIFTAEQLEGALRGVIATLNVQQLMRERQAFSDQISKDVSGELEKQGLILDSFQIKDITDNEDYIKSLGVPQIQEKWQAARIAEADSKRQVDKRQIETEEENLIEQTTLDENKQNSNARVGEARARADQAGKLAEAEAEQEVLEQNVENEERRLRASVNAKADSEKYRRQAEADAAAYEDQKRAEAEFLVSEQRAKAARVEAEAEAHAERERADAAAHAAREVGKARAEAIEAEAEAMNKNRDTYLADKVVEILPQLMESFTQGYSAIDGLTIIGGGGEGGSSASGHMATEAAGALESLKATTGLDLVGFINSSVQGTAFGNAMSNNRQNDNASTVHGETVATETANPEPQEQRYESRRDRRNDLPDID